MHPVVTGWRVEPSFTRQRVAARAGREVVVVDLLPGGRSDADVVARDRVAPDNRASHRSGPKVPGATLRRLGARVLSLAVCARAAGVTQRGPWGVAWRHT